MSRDANFANNRFLDLENQRGQARIFDFGATRVRKSFSTMLQRASSS